MNILFLNLHNNLLQHKSFDINMMNALSTLGTVYTLENDDWYERTLLKDNVHSIPFPNPQTLETLMSRVLYLGKKVMAIRAAVKQYHIDVVFFSTFFIKILPYILRFCSVPANHVFVIHHNTLDMIDRDSCERQAFLAYAHQIRHIVLEPFIAQYMTDTLGVPQERVSIVPHPLSGHAQYSPLKKYACVGLSGSNDPQMIHEIIEYEKQEHCLENSGAKTILKSKSETFDNGFLQVVNGYVPNAEFSDYVSHTTSVYIPLPKTFKYRCSGNVLEGVLGGSFIIGSHVPLIEYYVERYGGVFSLAGSAREFCERVLENQHRTYNPDAREQFIMDHSIEVISHALREALSPLQISILQNNLVINDDKNSHESVSFFDL